MYIPLSYLKIPITTIFLNTIYTRNKMNSYPRFFSFRLDNKYTPHGVDVYPQAAAGYPFDANCLACKGDPIANLQEDLAAEQKARATYEKLIDLCKDNPDVLDPLRYLREREIVHFQRFGEALRKVQDRLAEKRINCINTCMLKNNNCDKL